ncbi:hypothetical protein D915_003895 [Fasciola hepatica]|uniref:Tetraspanin n=1 Tax=Fasciola hepatica TaxID=6192 RepID=A0A4E0RVG9_FASHE|nr:hypothetical protein D915_003895 [Fasciola hepatica]
MGNFISANIIAKSLWVAIMIVNNTVHLMLRSTNITVLPFQVMSVIYEFFNMHKIFSSSTNVKLSEMCRVISAVSLSGGLKLIDEFSLQIWAISVFGVGVFLVLHHSPQSALFGEQLLQNIGYGFMIAGGILLLSVIHGCSIVCCRGKILTISFVVCLLILASILFFVGGFTIYKRFQIRDSLRNEMEHRFTMNYGFDLALTNAWDSTQWSYHCCGVAGPETYASSRWIRDPNNLSPRSSGLVPDSCCKRYDNQTYVNLDGCYISPLQEAEPFLYVHGCYEFIRPDIEKIILGTGILALSAGSVAVVFSVVLLCRFCGPHAVWV